MSDKTDVAVDKIVKALNDEQNRKPQGYDTLATVKRTEGKTAWVHIDGGVDETPVSMTVSCKKDDVVRVRVANGTAFIVGNQTNPPTDNTYAYYVQDGVVKLKEVVAGKASFEELEATNAHIGYLEADTAKIHDLTADEIHATTAYIQDLTADHITAEDISASSGYIKDLQSENITAQNIVADHATVGSLDANYAKIQDLNAAKGRIDNLEANEAVVNDTLKATNASIEYLESDWISTDRLVLTGNNKNNYPPVQITETEFNVNKTAYWTKSGNDYTQCTSSSVYNPDTQYYVRQTVKSIIEAINTANNTDPQVVVSNDKLIAASMDVAELSAITADMGTLTAGKIQKGNNFINLNTVPASMEFKNASTWANATQGIQFDTQGHLNIKGAVNITSGNVYTKTETDTAIDAIDVGGRNLLLDSAHPDKWSKESGISVVWDDTEKMFKLSRSSLSTAENTRYGIYQDVAVEPDTEYTLSVTGKKNDYIMCSMAVGATSWPADVHHFTTTKERYSYTFKTGSSVTSVRVYLSIRPYGTTVANCYGYINEPKLEKGNKATDWTPAPEDVQAEIDAKKSVHTLDTNYAYRYANILTYSAEGHEDSWNVSSTAGVKVGDTVRMKVSVNDMDNAPVYVVATVTAVSSATRISTISHGLDTTIIDGGKILTGSIGANQIAANAITIGKIDQSDTSTANALLNSKVAQYKQITSTYSVTEAQLTAWSAEGHSDTWSDHGMSNAGVNIGDTVAISATRTLTGKTIYFIVEVTSLSSTSGITGISHGYIDPEASGMATNYITKIDDNGIKIHAVNNPNSNYAKISADGMEIYKGTNKVASFTDTGAVIGVTSGKHMILNSDGLALNSNATTSPLKINFYYDSDGFNHGTFESTYNSTYNSNVTVLSRSNVSTVDIEANGTHSAYMSVYGSSTQSIINISAEKIFADHSLVIDNTGSGVYVDDGEHYSYPLIMDNGANLWIGAPVTASRHHTGKTFISSGWDSNNEDGNKTIYISVPNASNDGASNYEVYHAGNKQTGIPDAGNGTNITAQYSGSGIQTASWLGAWNGFKIEALRAAGFVGIVEDSVSVSSLGAGSTTWATGSYTTSGSGKILGILQYYIQSTSGANSAINIYASSVNSSGKAQLALRNLSNATVSGITVTMQLLVRNGGAYAS